MNELEVSGKKISSFYDFQKRKTLKPSINKSCSNIQKILNINDISLNNKPKQNLKPTIKTFNNFSIKTLIEKDEKVQRNEKLKMNKLISNYINSKKSNSKMHFNKKIDANSLTTYKPIKTKSYDPLITKIEKINISYLTKKIKNKKKQKLIKFRIGDKSGLKNFIVLFIKEKNKKNGINNSIKTIKSKYELKQSLYYDKNIKLSNKVKLERFNLLGITDFNNSRLNKILKVNKSYLKSNLNNKKPKFGFLIKRISLLMSNSKIFGSDYSILINIIRDKIKEMNKQKLKKQDDKLCKTFINRNQEDKILNENKPSDETELSIISELKQTNKNINLDKEFDLFYMTSYENKVNNNFEESQKEKYSFIDSLPNIFNNKKEISNEINVSGLRKNISINFKRDSIIKSKFVEFKSNMNNVIQSVFTYKNYPKNDEPVLNKKEPNYFQKIDKYKIDIKNFQNVDGNMFNNYETELLVREYSKIKYKNQLQKTNNFNRINYY